MLKRVLGSTDAAWLVAGNMIGAGIFITPGLVAGTLPGTLWPLVVWALGGVLALAGAAVYGELGARLPHAGGDYQYLHVAFGPLWGFLTGWAALIVTFSGAAAVMAIVAFENLATAWPVLMRFPAAVRGVLPAVAVVALTLANVAGARIAGKTTAWLTALPVAGLVLLFGWGVLVGGGRAAADAAVPDAGEGCGLYENVAYQTETLCMFKHITSPIDGLYTNQKDMSTFYLVRHAHTDWTPDENRPLSAQGTKDAAHVATILCEYPIDAIYSSPFRRARETILPLAEQLDLSVYLESDLRERKLGDAVFEDFFQAMEATWRNPAFAHPGGESSLAAQQRGIAMVERLWNSLINESYSFELEHVVSLLGPTLS